MITEQDIKRVLELNVKKHGVNGYAKKIDMSPTFISLVLNNKTRITENLARHLGFVKKIVWVRKNDNT